MPAIEIHNLTRRFGDLLAVDSITYQVEPGEIFGCLGHNGAGKTTSIRLMNGVLAPTSGTLRVLGLDPTADGPRLRQRTGVLTEAPSLDERLSARENLSIFADLYAVPKAEVEGRVDELLDQFGLGERAGDKVGGFSKGMKQRLALARALIHRPELLFLDEPTAGLDPVAARQVHELIRDLQRAGRTIYLCTHNLIEAQRLCDRVAVMRQGRLLALGTVGELGQHIAGEHDLELEIDPAQTDQARSLLEQTMADGRVGFERGMLVCRAVPRQQIPRIVTALTSAGIDVYRVSPQEATLEDVYFGLHAEGAP